MSVNMTVLETIRRFHDTTRARTNRTDSTQTELPQEDTSRAGTSQSPPSGGTATEREAYFRELATEIEDYVQQILPGLEGPDPVGETYLVKVGRLTMARSQAEEIALGDLLYPDPTDTDEEDQPSVWSAALAGLRADLDSDRAELNRILLDADTR